MSEKTIIDLPADTLLAEKGITLDNWDKPPFISWTFQHMADLFPVTTVSRGSGPVSHFDTDLQDLSGLEVKLMSGEQQAVRHVLAETDTAGLLVLHKGQIITEEYFGDMKPETLHLAQSVSKSIVGTLAGIYLDRGMLGRDRLVQDYVPELTNSGYANASIDNLLNMQTGVRFSEDYTDPDAEFALLDIAAGWKLPVTGAEPKTLRSLLKSLD